MAKKKIGIWMDHSNANLIELTTPMNTRIIKSEFSHQQKENTLSKSENLRHNKERQQQSNYYKKLGEEIRDYHEILLFGPTDAKKELLTILNADHRFENIKISILQADQMTDNQQHAFVKEHFKRK